MSRRWTAPEDALLRKRYGSEQNAQLGRRLGRTAQAVKRRAKRLGVQVNRPWTDEEDDHLRRLWGRRDHRILAASLGRTPQAVRQRASQLDLRYRQPWSAAEEELLRSRYGRVSAVAIGLRLRRSTKAVRARAQILGLQSERRDWTDDELAELEREYSATPSLDRVTERLDRDAREVRRKAKELGLVPLSAEAEELLWEMRAAPGVETLFRQQFGLAEAAVRQLIQAMEENGGPRQQVTVM